MAKYTKPPKPKKDWPLFAHANRQWAKKIRGRLHYFGPWSDPDAALAKWLDQKDDLLAGRTPRTAADGLTIRDLCNSFLTTKERQHLAGELTARSFADYRDTCRNIIAAFGKTRLVIDLAADDFDQLKADLAKRLNLNSLGNEIQRIRMVFKFGHDFGLIDTPVRFGPTFKRPPKRHLRALRQKNGRRDFTAAEVRKLLRHASQPLKAMILLGVNCGFGNNDCGTLPRSALDLRSGWLEFPRPKTAIERRVPLWPETIKAIREALEQRPEPKDEKHAELVFLTKYGKPWSKETRDNPVSQEFRKLLDSLDLHRHGVGFYALRRCFETVAGESRDQVAVDFIMGHADETMADRYREGISDARLRECVNTVRRWLFPKRAKTG